jgi:Pyridoxamine 5'-phosphate oxidase
MDIDRALDIIRTQHHAVLATTRPDGQPQMSPVLVTVDDEAYAVISTRETAYKVRNVRRHPRAWLCACCPTASSAASGCKSKDPRRSSPSRRHGPADRVLPVDLR